MKLRFLTCILLVFSGLMPLPIMAGLFTLREGKCTTLAFESSEAPVVKTVVGMFSGDYFCVFGGQVKLCRKDGNIVVGTWGSSLLKPIARELSFLKGRHEAFLSELFDWI